MNRTRCPETLTYEELEVRCKRWRELVGADANKHHLGDKTHNDITMDIAVYWATSRSRKRRKLVFDETIERIVKRHSNPQTNRELLYGAFLYSARNPGCPFSNLPLEIVRKILSDKALEANCWITDEPLAVEESTHH